MGENENLMRERCPGPPEGSGEDGADPGPCPYAAGLVWGMSSDGTLRTQVCAAGCGHYRMEN